MNKKAVEVIGIIGGLILIILGVVGIYWMFNNPYSEGRFVFNLGGSIVPIALIIIGIYLIWRFYMGKRKNEMQPPNM